MLLSTCIIIENRCYCTIFSSPLVEEQITRSFSCFQNVHQRLPSARSNDCKSCCDEEQDGWLSSRHHAGCKLGFVHAFLLGPVPKDQSRQGWCQSVEESCRICARKCQKRQIKARPGEGRHAGQSNRQCARYVHPPQITKPNKRTNHIRCKVTHGEKGSQQGSANGAD